MGFSIIDHPAIGIPLFEETTISACSIDFRISMTSCHQKPHSSLVYQLGKAHFKPQTTAWSCPSCTKSIGSRHSHAAQHAAGTFDDLALSGVSDLGRAGWIKKKGKTWEIYGHFGQCNRQQTYELFTRQHAIKHGNLENPISSYIYRF